MTSHHMLLGISRPSEDASEGDNKELEKVIKIKSQATNEMRRLGMAWHGFNVDVSQSLSQSLALSTSVV